MWPQPPRLADEWRTRSENGAPVTIRLFLPTDLTPGLYVFYQETGSPTGWGGGGGPLTVVAPTALTPSGAYFLRPEGPSLQAWG
jgi:hypothetical protein